MPIDAGLATDQRARYENENLDPSTGRFELLIG
jgi:hypothetical protein